MLRIIYEKPISELCGDSAAIILSLLAGITWKGGLSVKCGKYQYHNEGVFIIAYKEMMRYEMLFASTCWERPLENIAIMPASGGQGNGYEA